MVLPRDVHHIRAALMTESFPLSYNNAVPVANPQIT